MWTLPTSRIWRLSLSATTPFVSDLICTPICPSVHSRFENEARLYPFVRVLSYAVSISVQAPSPRFLDLHFAVWTPFPRNRVDLPQLRTLHIGRLGEDSYNFYWLEHFTTVNTPCLESIEAGDYSFYWCMSVQLSNSPQLRFRCGESAFEHCDCRHFEHEDRVVVESRYPSFMYLTNGCRSLFNKHATAACGFHRTWQQSPSRTASGTQHAST